MNHGWLFVFILTAPMIPQSTAGEPVAVSEHAERDQHRYLALSLRNQKLLEQQAESKARQLAFQLQSAQALAAIRKLSVDRQELSHEGLAAPLDTYSDLQLDLQGFIVRAIFSWRDRWIARIEYGQRLYVVRDGDTLFDRIDIGVSADGVTLTLGEQNVFLRGTALW
ncbi:hypothetical protein [Aliidiomarina indica]|uniref:hypothetical protein n=1 Tax=Aliidiomarina indica TaxID=2749147 RepID=UPI00188F717B|nr:hypothetical protein [Aliidiomarina indica]